MRALSGPFVFPMPRSERSGRAVDLAFPQSRLTGLTRTFAFAVVFIAGWYLCLPESEFVEVPWWASKFAIGPNILVHEALFAVYLVVGGLRSIVRASLRQGYVTFSASLCIAVLALWCGAVSLMSPLPFHDVGRSARLILMALLLLGVTHWAATNPLFILRTFLLGLTCGTLVNLTLTFLNPVTAGVLPRLLGQNAPGPPMGIAVCLSSWLILLSHNRRDTFVGIVVAVICGFGAAISYSKTGMLAAAMGFVSIVIVSGKVAGSRRGRVLLSMLFATVLAGAGYLGGDGGRLIRDAFAGMLQEKVQSARYSESGSMQQRWSYVLGVSEIVARYPIGVGYSGFRGAMMETEAYHSGLAADEAPIATEDSNPHALFLYYASAGGILGGVLAGTIFILLCRALLRGLAPYGRSGALLALFCCLAYFVLAISVQYLFNSSVMLIPAGLSAGTYAHLRMAGFAGGGPKREPSIAPPIADDGQQ